MGLDMYAYAVNKGILEDTDQVDVAAKLFTDGKANEGVNTDFGYWRKFNHLHGWMERLYREKGGTGESFNCNTVRLTADDLDRLERDAKAGENLDPTNGFFFGSMDKFDVEDQQTVLDFVRQAREVVQAGGACIYDSWWQIMKLSKIHSASQPNTFVVSSGALRVTDPCYDIDTWCAGTLENVENGVWHAHVGYHKDELDTEMSERWLVGERERIDSFAAKFGKDGLGDFVNYENERLEQKRKELEAHPGRVAYLHIRHENASSDFDREKPFDATWGDSTIDVGVDSGQAGFFDLALFKQVCEAAPVKDKFYDEICALTCDTEGDWGVHPVGCVSMTGWGDGSYTCLVRRNQELRLVEAIIIYLSEDEDEGNEEDDSGE